MCFTNVMSPPAISSPAITGFSLSTFIHRSPFRLSDAEDVGPRRPPIHTRRFSCAKRLFVLIYQRFVVSPALVANRLAWRTAEEDPTRTARKDLTLTMRSDSRKPCAAGNRPAKVSHPEKLHVGRDD